MPSDGRGGDDADRAGRSGSRVAPARPGRSGIGFRAPIGDGAHRNWWRNVFVMSKANHVVSVPGALLIRAAADDALRLPNLWLRDNCDCTTCHDTQTGEKRFILSDVGADIAPKASRLDGDTLTVTWPDGHESCYSLAAIRALRQPRHPRWRPWPDGFAPSRVDWSDLLADDSVAVDALGEFLCSGVLVMTGAPTTAGSLETLSARLGPLREVEFDRIHEVALDPRGYNVAHTAQALPPHNDFASYTWPPSVQALHMLVNDVDGGRSIVVDGFALLADFQSRYPAHFDCLCAVPVPFSMFDDDTVTWAAAPLIRRDSAGEVVGLRFSNQLMQTPDPTARDVDAFYRAYHALCQYVGEPRFRVMFRLSAGDVLLVAAHRVLHAREAFVPGGRRHLQDAYFELDNVANRLVVLRRNRSNEHE